MTAAPYWLKQQWKNGSGVPQSLVTGSLEERASRILETVKNEMMVMSKDKTIKPVLSKVLALDLVAAAADQGKLPKQVEKLLVYVLGLAEGHEAGGWYPWDVERRGGRKPEETEAWCAAAMIDHLCYEKYGKVLSQHALAWELKTRGFKWLQRRIGEWRRDKYGVNPGERTYVPPDAPKMTLEEAREKGLGRPIK